MPFLNETAFLRQAWGAVFRVLKLKSRDLLPRKLVQACNPLISNCCQNFVQLDSTVLEL